MKQPNSSRLREAAFRAEWRKGKPKVPTADRKPGAGGAGTGFSASAANGQPEKRPDKQKRRQYLRQYIRWLWPYRFALLVVFLLALASAALDMVWPLAIRKIIDGVLLNQTVAPPDKLRQLNYFGGTIVALLVLKQAIDSFRSYRTTVLNA